MTAPAAVMVNVLGEFPPASINALLGLEEVERAMRRYSPGCHAVQLPSTRSWRSVTRHGLTQPPGRAWVRTHPWRKSAAERLSRRALPSSEKTKSCKPMRTPSPAAHFHAGTT